MTSRRQFMMTVVPAALVLPAVSTSVLAADNRVDEKDGAAVGLGYKHDATKVDAKKYATYKAGSNCANCQFYQAKATDPWGGCPLLGGKQVNAKGWCSAWAKKA
jgi:High potential iron-sulfur protein